jgi:hypothetical protein
MLAAAAHVSWGLEYRDGVSTARRAIIAWVESKKPRSLLGDDAFPASFLYKGRSYLIDVRQIAHGRKQASTVSPRVCPGQSVRVDGEGGIGTLGALFGPGGGNAVISGHVAGRPGALITATPSNGATFKLGKVAHYRNDKEVDSAIVALDDPSASAALGMASTANRDLGADDVGVRVRALLRSGRQSAVVSAVGAPADFGSDGMMTGMVQLDPRVTDGGDSGAPVVDLTGAVVGYVVGFGTTTDPGNISKQHTYLLPAGEAYDLDDF